MEQFIGAYKTAFSRYADFTGRTSVGGYWRFFLVNFLIALALGILASQSAIFGLLYVVYALGAFLPSLAIAVRRLHDTGKSGWILLISLIPIVGFIVLLVFLVGASMGTNAYGAAAED